MCTRNYRNYTLVVGTANPDKLKELRHLLGGLGLRVIPVGRFGKVPRVVENGATFEANAAKKARVYSRLSGHLTLADDSGLAVRSLGGRPGVYSARFAGAGCAYADNNRKLLRLLGRKPRRSRAAAFHCVIALYRKGKKVRIFGGKCSGRIALAASGKNGFGYDPVFVPCGLKKTFADLSHARKNKISHRAMALRKVRRYLLSKLRVNGF